MFWWVMKYVVLGPPLRLAYRPLVLGLENVPDEGGAILAANHQSFLDDLLLPLVIRGRKVQFLAKAEYIEKWYLRWFFKGANVIPVRRGGGSQSEAALVTGVQALRDGHLIGIFPEGTRSPDGRLYRGKTGVARMALEAGVPVIPVGIIGTFEAMPYNRKLPKARTVELRFGTPLTFERYRETPVDRFALRAVTDEIMYEIMMLSGQEYSDEYATRVKAQIARRERREPAAETDRAAAEDSTTVIDDGLTLDLTEQDPPNQTPSGSDKKQRP
jgi:1-acyl-sn-glycerol-3-phosphate acyltransferase